MIPGMNPRDMQKAMKRLGIKQEEIEASEVIIKTADKNLIIRNPSITKINMGGQESLQIAGNIEEEVAISEDDVNTVAEQTQVSKEEAREALEANDGDLAAAIMALQK